MFLNTSLATTGTTEEKKQEIPLIESTTLEVLYSDEGVVVAKMTTEKRFQYENGDSIYPVGMYVELYDKEKNIIGTLRANTVYQYANKDIWELKGDVEVKGYKDGDEKQLNTEELYWDQKAKQIYTPKFVRIETENELLTGYGLSAMQDLTYYNLSAPQGFVNIDSTELE
ncbi:MAG: LPS export ABC transporter periplasmic protein LptC [Candidatus Amoebophilus sp. 36-38]|nr:MAG: LPS export ABC transporter periplasmic protein LptC [Candidatus Amoebophilus sp. 36-38]